MTLVIASSQPDIPDYDHEIHTILVDNIEQNSKTDFTVFLPTPLENVVQARLISASLTTTNGTDQKAFHIGIEELRTHFTQQTQAKINYGGDSDSSVDTKNHLNGVFGTITGYHNSLGAGSLTKVFLFRDEYPIIQCYHNPIRKLNRLTFNIDKQDGTTASVGDSTFIFRVTCRKKNLL
ncbi:hypothetical protein N8613_04135 [Verrucomicrobia bacterium]|jgi:hypothetical protein|nr:hypothetical protein [Verrucomicrobiota bacterium]